MPSPEFFNVIPVADALALVFKHWQPAPKIETIATASALNRITAQPIYAPMAIPPFRKSTVDGYAVLAKDTSGASQALPAYLRLSGEILMGTDAAGLQIKPYTTMRIHTGGMLPDNADAVVMIEYTQALPDDEIEVLRAVAPGENVIQVGEDVRENGVILSGYHRIRAQDIGGLLASGITEVEVLRPLNVGILSCGDELIHPAQTPAPGQIRDINAYTLSALVEQNGGDALHAGIAPDRLEDYRHEASDAFAQTDLLVLTAGSSVSTRDYTRDVIEHLGQPGILQHGLATKPGKPAILAVCDNKPVIGLPGNPVSALLVARQFLPALIAHYTKQPVPSSPALQATLSMNIASVTGREDWVAVHLKHDVDNRLLAEPVFGKSNLIYTLIQADGLVTIPLNSGGLKAGTIVDVMPF